MIFSKLALMFSVFLLIILPSIALVVLVIVTAIENIKGRKRVGRRGFEVQLPTVPVEKQNES